LTARKAAAQKGRRRMSLPKSRQSKSTRATSGRGRKRS
jgi:hypothetical protein